jgi:alanine racemase
VRPSLTLDPVQLRENARSWIAFAGVPLRAVVKSDGYGWGFAALVEPLDDLVDAFVVADSDEFDAVRALTRRPILTLAETPPEAVNHLLDGNALPNIASSAGIEAASRWARKRQAPARIRIGVRPAVGWAGFEVEEVPQIATALARPELAVELWTHLTAGGVEAEQLAAFARARTLLQEAGVAVVATDIESSLPLRAATARGSFVRIGVGLFGARSGPEPAGVRCALRVEAPLVAQLRSAGQPVGYGAVRAPGDGYLEVVRCGYGDGFVRLAGVQEILSVGMQYTVLWRRNLSADKSVVLLDAASDLNQLANAAGVAPHELVVRLGLAKRAAQATAEPPVHRELR